MHDLEFYRGLARLRDAARKHNSRASPLEIEFLSFSAKNDENVLNVHIPKMFELKNDDLPHYQKAMQNMGIGGAAKFVDISGASSEGFDINSIAFVSSGQFNSDYISERRSYLTPL